MPDPKIITSRHSGLFTRDGVTVEVNIIRLEATKWTLEVVNGDNTSTVWDDEFDTDDAAYEEFLSTVEQSGLLEFRTMVSGAMH